MGDATDRSGGKVIIRAYFEWRTASHKTIHTNRLVWTYYVNTHAHMYLAAAFGVDSCML